MKSLFCCSFLLLLVCTGYSQQIRYQVSFNNAIHHEASISVTAEKLPAQPAVFRMSRSSPGRYATHEFGKNVYDVSATDQQGKKLVINRIDGDVYEVPKHNGTVTVTYTLYANYADGTYAGIDPESIHLNMPACFMWVKGMDKAPIEITFNVPAGNKGKIATQLYPTAKPNTFTAPGLQYFMDSPTKIGDLFIRDWTMRNVDGKEYTIRIALEADASAEQVDNLAERTGKIVSEAYAVYGEFPDYANSTYTFLMSANPFVYGDGMEHRNSTMISSTMQTFNPARLMGVTAHEYFHNWNVERIRPKTLEPFNFEKSNMSNELWFAEGFTQYYGELLLARAGLKAEQNQLMTMSGLVNTKTNTPGAKFYSPIHSSNHAVFVDASVSIDKNNYSNMFTSYYTYGAALALALDLELQTRYGKTLDAYMQAMWKRFGKKEIPYTITTMQETLAGITDAGFAEQFFTKYIRGHESIDYGSLFAQAGYDLKKANEGKASIGLMASKNDQDKLVITSNTQRGTAAYLAGLDIQDEILKLDETVVKTTADINAYIDQKKPGDLVKVTYKHRGKENTTQVTLQENASLTLVPFEQSGKTVTDNMKKIRNSWFTSQVK